MGPDDFLAMSDGYQLRREEKEKELYLLRHIAYVAHNAMSEKASQLSSEKDLMRLSVDKVIEKNQKKRVQERKKKSDALFEKARKRGVLDDNEETEE